VGGGFLTAKPVEGLCDTVAQSAGYFTVTTATKNYFYWFFESRGSPSTDPVILWMTGGPGCSGQCQPLPLAKRASFPQGLRLHLISREE
jgi:carboxypeptidase C (cathepsin A)